MPIHPRDRLNDCAVFGPLRIEDVPGDDDVLGAMLGGGSPKRVNGVEPGFRQRPADIGIKATKGFAELPVGRVNELHFALKAFVADNGHSICSSVANRSLSVQASLFCANARLGRPKDHSRRHGRLLRVGRAAR